MFAKHLLRVGAMLAVVATGVPMLAQDNELAWGRAAYFVADGPPLQTYIDGEAVGELLTPFLITEYVPLPPGNHLIEFTPEAEDEPAVSVQTATEAGHEYAVVIAGSEDGITAQVIDETVALEGIDVETEDLLILFHSLEGAPPITLSFDGAPIVENLAYGEMATVNVPLGPVDEAIVANADDPNDILARPPIFSEFQPNVLWLVGLMGRYPGEPGQDYFLNYLPLYKGEVMNVEGGAIEIGSPATGEIGLGERVTYSLTIDSDAMLDINLIAPADSFLDAYLRIYDADGDLVAENDEISFEDEGADAGLLGLALSEGEYTIEVSSWNDSFAGGYALMVEEAAE